ncbi:alpha/beta fold hydrolase [Metabacillus sp. Hm71]|uniref:alpha/beta fold hydrolase n=1 Tax=Metabacillus sp. Hm71 TaxID=3450743 RepID=UPI003F43C2FD
MSKTPLLLVPGTLCDERLWKHQIESLSDLAEVKVCDVTRQDSITGLAKSILEEAPDKFALAGLSLGGIISLEIMRLAPERVKKLALLDTNPTPPKSEQISGWEKFIDMANNGQFLTITIDHLIPVLIHPDRRKDDSLVETILDMAKKIGKDAYINQLKAVMGRLDQRPILATIKCPTMVIVGKEDRVCPIQMSEFIAENIATSCLEIIDKCGHLSTLEQPEIVSILLRKWLNF